MSWSARNPSSSSTSHSEMEPTTPLTTPNAPSSVSSVSPAAEHVPNSNHIGDQQPSNGVPASESNPEQTKERATVPSACVQCRSKHLKCDGLSPCSRCLSNSFECIYVRSRRGFKGPRRNGTQTRAPSISGVVAGRSCPMINPAAARVPSDLSTGLVTPPDNKQQSLPRMLDLPLFDASQDVVAFPTKQLPSNMSVSERCIEAYFYHFHPAHPIIVPRDYFMQLRTEKAVSHLEAAMRYAGSFFVPQASTVTLGVEAERALYHADCPRDGFRVQALLILCVALDGNTNQEKALKMLLEGQDQALDLGMNRRDFAATHADGSAVLAESWRRTWWEMFIVDGMIAGVHQKSTFRMKDLIADVALPCEEREYAMGEIPQPHTIDDFDNDGFDGRDFTYSSYVYRIAALRNLGRVLSQGMMTIPNEDIIDRLDAFLVNWRLHLPESKRDFINPDGQLDEMLFQAHMITEATTVMLHREHSELDSSIARTITSCAPHKEILPGQSFNVHAAKTIKAAQSISKLIQLPVPLVKHTHFFTCVVTLASIVHLMCWGAMMPLTYDDDLKQQLRLNTGALKTLWQVWPAAGKAFGQVKGVAQDMYAAKKQAIENGYWASLTHDEVMKSLMEDQGIMEDLHLLA